MTTRSGVEPKRSRFAFAMFDVLGFSRWVEWTGLEDILAAYVALIERAVLKPSEKLSLTAVQTPEGALLVVARAPHYVYFSDTILLWCELVPQAVGDFVERCSDLVCEGLAMGIPLRGAITLGDAVLDGDANIFLGRPIVEAHNVERGQNWIGITLGNSAVWEPFLVQVSPTALIEYPPPMKDALQGYASPIVVDWPRRWRDKRGQCPSPRLRELNTQPEFAQKWANTIAFAEYSLRKHDWHLRPNEIPAEALLRLRTREEARFG